ncbi:MAG: HipA domain-containing protein [Gemmatimonadota bacterium]|nr:HipA domain-containing protein [Gemmatimonadota bacterium]MDE2863878.1 HipA domain-containing protein [Gemmatimonadota bacterium]
MADIGVLDVRLHGRSIGTLTRLGRDRIVFGFDPQYVDDPDRATLSLSFRDPFGGLVTDFVPTRTWVHPFFSNLLPEGSLLEYLARAAGIDPRAEFELLAALGEDLPGAVTTVPIDIGPGAGQRTPGRSTPDSVVGPWLRLPAPLRFSIAGVQPKLSAAMAAGKLTVPVHGVGGSWIVKLPSAAFPGLPEQEHAMMKLAGLNGIDVPETRLVPVEEIEGLPPAFGTGTGQALAVRRFDRLDDGTRVHIEDFAQILGAHPEQKYLRAGYREIAEVLGRELGDDAVTQFVRRLVFCAMIGNGDAHLKNWSVIYPDRRNPQLAPAYDLVSTIAYVDDDRMALEWVSGERGFTDLSDDLLARLASGARLAQRPVVKAGREAMTRFLDVWATVKLDLGMPDDMVAGIERNANRVWRKGKRS